MTIRVLLVDDQDFRHAQDYRQHAPPLRGLARPATCSDRQAVVIQNEGHTPGCSALLQTVVSEEAPYDG